MFYYIIKIRFCIILFNCAEVMIEASSGETAVTSSSTRHKHTGTMEEILSFHDPFIRNQTEEHLHVNNWPQSLGWVNKRAEVAVCGRCAHVTILSDQSVACSVFTPPFGISSAHMGPRQRWWQKKEQVLSTTFDNAEAKRTSRSEPSRAKPSRALQLKHSGSKHGVSSQCRLIFILRWNELKLNFVVNT